MTDKDRKMVAILDREPARQRRKLDLSPRQGQPKDRYRDEGVAKVLKAASAPIIDSPMSAEEMLEAIRRG